MTSNNSLVTVITVTFNAAAHLEKTIQSVIGQDYPHLEYIIIDGGSTDETIEIIQKYEKDISYWISESDSGIYDAMNKGVRYAKGQYINFMNSGDQFFANTTIRELFDKSCPDSGLIYGNTLFYEENSEGYLVKAKSLDELWKAMVFNHNGLFCKRELLIKFPFDLNYKIVADSKFVIECYKDNQKFEFIDMLVNKYLIGGFSDENSVLRTVERWKLVSDFNMKPQKKINDFYFKRLLDEPFYKEKNQRDDFLMEQVVLKNHKILIYSPIPIFPAVQGARIRIAMLAQSLKERGYELYLVLFGTDWIEQNSQSEKIKIQYQYNSLFSKIIEIPKTKNHGKLMGKNIDIDDAYEEHVGETIKKVMLDNDIKVVLFNYIFQSKALELLPADTVKILDTHDKFTDKYKISNWYSYDARNEAIGLSRADLVFAIQDAEKKYFESIANKKVITVGHLTKESFFDRAYNEVKIIGIISSGHIQDLNAIEKFIKIFLEKKFQGIKLKICGMVCNALASKFIHPSIEYLFLVEDLKEFYSAIDVCIIPPEGGTGLKIKSVEALSYGLPIVSTRHGFEGIETNSRFHGARDINELIQFIEELKDRPSLLAVLKEESRDCYLAYSRQIETNLDLIFGEKSGLKTSSKSKNFVADDSIKLNNIFNQSSEEQEEFFGLFESIKKVSTLSIYKNPIQKYKAYKGMLRVYHSLKKGVN